MDWIAALCLSVPPTVGFVLLAREIHKRCEMSWDATREAAILLNETLKRTSEANERIAALAADAHVRAARYTSGAVRVKPKREPLGKETIFDTWLSVGGGKGYSGSVRDSVQWAIGRLRGEESDEQGDEETACRILRQWAPGVEAAVRSEITNGA